MNAMTRPWFSWLLLVGGAVLSGLAAGGLWGLDRSGTPLVGHFAQWWILWLGVAVFLAGAVCAGYSLAANARRRPGRHGPAH